MTISLTASIAIFSGFVSGLIHSLILLSGRMSGIRSWIRESSSVGSFVRITKELKYCIALVIKLVTIIDKNIQQIAFLRDNRQYSLIGCQFYNMMLL